MGAQRFDFVHDNSDVEARNPGNGNCAIEQGATWSFTLDVYDSSGALIDLTSYAARMSIRKNYGDSTAIDELTDSSEITLASTSPNLTVTIAASVTAAYDWSGKAKYDLEIDDQDTTPVVTRLLYGEIELLPEATT